MTTPIARIALTLVAVLVFAVSAGAQDNGDAARSLSPVEITPYVALGSNGSSGVGGAVRWPLGSRFSLELETGYRRAEIDGLTTSLSLLYDLPAWGRLTPYAVAGTGIEQFGTVFQSPDGRLATRKGTALTINAGGGVRVAVNDRWGVRTDARWSNGLGWQAPERWRLYNGITFGRSGR
jgi:opacity protein-like surface antigen